MEGDLSSFVDRSRAVIEESSGTSARTTDLRITLPFLRTLGWDVHGTDVVGEYVVESESESHRGDESDGEGENADGAKSETGGDGEEGSDVESDDGDVDSVVVDYALQIDGQPAVFLMTAGVGESMAAEDRRRLETAMDAAGVEWGLATNGDVFTFVAADDDGPREVTCELADLPDHRSLVARYSRAAARRRHEQRRERLRQSAADELAGRAESLTAAVADALVADGVPAPVAEELRDTAAVVVEGTLDALADGSHPKSGIAGQAPDPSPPEVSDAAPDPAAAARSDGDAAATSPAPDDAATSGSPSGDAGSDHGGSDPSIDPGSANANTDADANADANADADADAAAETADDDPDGAETDSTGGDEPGDRLGAASAPGGNRSADEEYVVRFFDGGSSVGAIGHGTSAGALVQAADYLIANHGLDGAIDLPWGPTDDRAVLNHDPVHPDGTEMVDAAQLANGYFACTTIPPEAIREVVEELADVAGLRVMFQGDW